MCELEEEGRLEEAQALFEASTTEAERVEFQQAQRNLAEALSKISPEAIAEAEEIMKRFRSLKNLPEEHPKRVVWDQFWTETPRFMSGFWRYLPDPLANPGRPKGSGRVTEEMLVLMDERTLSGCNSPTAAAKSIVGDVAGQKNRADNLVKVWKRKRGFK